MTVSMLLGEYSFQSALASRSPPLAHAEELELARRFRAHSDRRAGELLARAHLRDVVFLATKHRHYGVPVSELIAEGNCGLVDALRKFDPERGVRFSSYAKHWIRAYVLAHIIRSRVSVGGNAGIIRSQLFFKLRRERARMNNLLGGSDATDAALASRLNISVTRLRDLLQRLDCREVSLDAPADGQSSVWLPDLLISSSDPEQAYLHHQRRTALSAAVSAALRGLDVRERFIVERRLMAPADDELTLEQIATDMGVSRERARQLEQRAKQKLMRSSAIRRHQRLESLA
jgi:RNA polymerase sigma-32 factor